MPYLPTLFGLHALSTPLPGELAREPFFLDPGAVDSFDEWLQASPNHFNLLGSGWNVVVACEHYDQLALTHPTLFKPLKRSNRIIRPPLIPRHQVPQLPPKDQWMVNELLQLIFNGDVRHRQRAELLTLARRVRHGAPVYLISNCARFDRVPDCVTYYVPNHLAEEHSLPVVFEPFSDLQIHEEIKKVSQSLLLSGHFPSAIQEASKAIGEAVRGITGDTTNTTDAPLMEYWFSCVKSANPAARKEPRLKLAELYDTAGNPDSDTWSEAVGYSGFFNGVVTAFRNPTAHNVESDPFMASRFGNKTRALKVLCFLSLLLERLDECP